VIVTAPTTVTRYLLLMCVRLGRVIGSMNEYVWQLGSYLARTADLLELSLQLNNTPMSAVGSKSSYGFPDEVARDLLMNWEH